MFEYLSQVQSAVRRFNDRMQTLANNLGTNDLQYKRMEAKIDALFTENMVYKNGVANLKMPKDIFTDPEKNEILEEIDQDFKTYGQLKKEFEAYKRDYKTYDEKSAIPEIENIQTFSNWLDELPDKIRKISKGEIVSPTALEILKESDKTYADLQRVSQYADASIKRKARKKVSDTFK